MIRSLRLGGRARGFFVMPGSVGLGKLRSAPTIAVAQPRCRLLGRDDLGLCARHLIDASACGFEVPVLEPIWR